MFLKLNELTELDFNQAAPLLQEADILLFRSRGFFSYLIKRVSEGLYSHVGIASSHYHDEDDEKIWECIEFREWKGGRSVSLQTYIRTEDVVIDVYRPTAKKIVMSYNTITDSIESKIVRLNTHDVTDTMRKMTGLPYGWRRIAWMAQFNLPVLRWFYSMESLVDDCCLEDLVYPVCSTAIAHSFSKAGYDLIHNRSDIATEPSDISRSALLNYLFTIKNFT